MAMQNFQSVDAYLKAQPANFRTVLEKLRAQIKAAAPQAEESISYGMPAYKYNGPLVYFGAFKKHCSFFPGNSTLLARQKGLTNYKISKGTIQFTAEKPLPATLVQSIVKARMLQNETRAALKSKDKPVKNKPGKKTNEQQ